MLSLILVAAFAVQDSQAQVPTHRAQQVWDNAHVAYELGGNVSAIAHNDHGVLINCQFERSLLGLPDTNRAIPRQIQGIIGYANLRARLLKEQYDFAPEKKDDPPQHLLALKTDGKPWGNNHSGQLGDGATTHRSVCVDAVSGWNWKMVSVDVWPHINADGRLWAFDKQGNLVQVDWLFGRLHAWKILPSWIYLRP